MSKRSTLAATLSTLAGTTMLTLMGTSTALATCSDFFPADGTSVICDATPPNPTNQRVSGDNDVTVTVLDGAIVSSDGDTIFLDDNATVIVNAGGTVDSTMLNGSEGIDVNFGTVTVGGTVTADGDAVEFDGGISALRSFVTVLSGGLVRGGTDGGGDGIEVRPNAGATIIIENGATVTGASRGIDFIRGAGDITNAGLIESTNASPVAIEFSPGVSTDDRLELQTGSQINGLVLAGPGTDTLAFGGDTGTLAFDISTVDGNNTDDGEQYLNFETFLKEDAGTTTFTGTNTEITAFTVNGGLLNINGSMPNTVFTVNDGTLGGTGTLGTLNIAPGATLAPGNSIGTLNVTDATVAAGSTYDVEINAAGQSDLLAASGTVTLQGGTVNVIELSPAAQFVQGQQYTIVTANGGVNGQFAGTSDGGALVTYTLSYPTNQVVLTRNFIAPMVNDTTGNVVPNFLVPANTFNTTQLATGLLDFDFVAEPTVLSSLLGLDETQLNVAYNELTGEVHAEAAAAASAAAGEFDELLTAMAARNGSAAGVSVATLGVPADGLASLASGGLTEIDAGRYGADIIVSDPVPPVVPLVASYGPTVWLGGLGAFADVDGDGNAAGYDLATYGVALGIEQDYEGLARAGFAIGYTHADLDLSRPQNGDIETVHIGLYGSMGASRLEQGFAARGSLSYAHHWIDTTRDISFGTLARTAEADYDGDTISGDIEARYNFAFGDSAISPFVRGQFGRTSLDTFAETGAGGLNLSGSASDFDASSVAVGVAFAADYDLGGIVWSPSISVAYERLTGDDNGAAALNLAGSPTIFAVAGTEENRDRLRVGAISSFALSDKAALTMAADSVYSEDRTDFSVKAGLKFTF